MPAAAGKDVSIWSSIRQSALRGVGGYLAALLAITLFLPAYHDAREQAFDGLLTLLSRAPDGPGVVIIDIDSASLERIGPWPWERQQLARLISNVADAGPVAIGLDILLDGPDQRSPAALARRLAETTGRADLLALSRGLLDGDEEIAKAVAGRNVVLGLALMPSPGSARPMPPARVLKQPEMDVSGYWRAPGLSSPPDKVTAAASGFGILALAGDHDGRVRRAPLFAAVGRDLRPGLALETVRLARDQPVYILAQGRVRAGELNLPAPGDGMLRLLPNDDGVPARVISAADILDGRAREGLSGLIVLVGTSAPEAGGLRIGHSGALVPSVALHAQAVTQLLSGLAPRRPAFATLLEAVVCAAVAAIGLLAAARLPPGPAGLIAIGTSVAWLIMVCAALAVGTILLDPLSVPLAGLGSYGIVALLAAAQTRRREDALRRRFEQHLAPEIVRRIVANPDLLRLAGEQREVTALFTDVEGFTAMTERAAPDRLIAALDRYFETLCAIVVRHGGMVEKIVGDGLHALFNAPLDLPDHASRALACAEEIAAFGRSFSKQPDIAEIGFGRTRVGLETGIVVVGDVGGGGRLDYTAHGNAMNTAARLEAANKDLGTTICIGGRAARQIGAEKLRPLGSLNVRGRAEPLDIYEPWPIDMTAAQRAAYASGIALIGHDRPAGLKLIEIVALERLHDRALAKVLERLRARQD